jgi:hypothetical protein
MRPVHISSLVNGDEVYAYMRLGLAVECGQRGDGSLYGKVPNKPQKAGPSDYTRWQGLVLQNNVTEKVLTCHITATNSMMLPQNRETITLVADVHYSAFRRLRLLSKINFEPHQYNLTFPANLSDAAFKPYKTWTEVRIPSFVTGV